MQKRVCKRKIGSRGLVGMLLGAILGLSPGALLAASWHAELWVKAGNGANRLVIGQKESATEGYDPQWEVEAFLPKKEGGAQAGDVEAYFPHPEWGRVHVNYWQDIRSPATGEPAWSLTVTTALPDLPVEIRWDPSGLDVGLALHLIDEATGDIIDMHLIDYYTYSGSASRGFRIEDTSVPDLPPPLPPPPSPALKGSRRGKAGASLQWNGVPGDVIGYNVYRSTTPGEGYDKINPDLVVGKKPKGKKTTKLVYIDKGLVKGNKYYYVVTSISSEEVESPYSNEVMVNIK